MSYNNSDIAKVSMLLLILLIISYTAFQKFVLTPYYINNNINPQKIFSMFERYDICNKIEDNELKQNCKIDFQASYKDAEIKCKGYMTNFINCKNNNQRSPCQIELSNVGSCISSVVYDVANKYNPPYISRSLS